MRGQGVGGEPKTRKPSICSSVLGTPCERVLRSDAGSWWVRVDNMEAVVGLRVRQHEARGRGLSQKPESRASVAWFRTCHVIGSAERWEGVVVTPRPGDLESGGGV